MTRRLEVCVDIYLDEFDDEDIMNEAIKRDLTQAICYRHRPVDDARNILLLLMANHNTKATAALKKLVAQLLPEEINAALEAVENGRFGDAISELERYSFPTPAATAKTLPNRNEAAS